MKDTVSDDVRMKAFSERFLQEEPPKFAAKNNLSNVSLFGRDTLTIFNDSEVEALIVSWFGQKHLLNELNMQRVYSTYCVHENVMLHIFWIKVIYLRVNVLYVFNFNFSTVHEHLNTNNPAVVDPSTLFLFDGPHTYFDPNTHMKKKCKNCFNGWLFPLTAGAEHKCVAAVCWSLCGLFECNF